MLSLFPKLLLLLKFSDVWAKSQWTAQLDDIEANRGVEAKDKAMWSEKANKFLSQRKKRATEIKYEVFFY